MKNCGKKDDSIPFAGKGLRSLLLLNSSPWAKVKCIRIDSPVLPSESPPVLHTSCPRTSPSKKNSSLGFHQPSPWVEEEEAEEKGMKMHQIKWREERKTNLNLIKVQLQLFHVILLFLILFFYFLLHHVHTTRALFSSSSNLLFPSTKRKLFHALVEKNIF